jgi:dCMP deaminase
MTTLTHEELIDMARELGSKSKDSAQVGCVIVSSDGDILSTGWARIPDRINDTDARHTRPAKYFWIEHAERIAIYNAAKNGTCLNGATAYINYSPESICTQCIRALVQSGIVRFVGSNQHLNSNNRKNHHAVNQHMIQEANIEIITIDNDEQDKTKQ